MLKTRNDRIELRSPALGALDTGGARDDRTPGSEAIELSWVGLLSKEIVYVPSVIS